ncbi:MAG: hypothetical protein KAR83_04270 [Thermodesulfovibrionales bacterium]|nr:hypothetical protein [Thermodesulfovibrionales bacterium]
MKNCLITALMFIMVFVLACDSGEKAKTVGSGDTATSKKASDKAGAFPADAYGKVKDSVSTEGNVIDEKQMAALLEILPGVADLAEKAIAPSHNTEEMVKLEALAKQAGIANISGLADKLIVYGNAGFSASMLHDFQKQIDDGAGSMMPDMAYDPVRNVISKSKLTRADLELALKHKELWRPSGKMSAYGRMIHMGQ